LKTKDITRISFLSSILVCVFLAFSQIMYLELVTTTLLLYSLNLEIRDSFMVALIFGAVLLLIFGIQSFSIMYMIIFPIFALIISFSKKLLNKNNWLIIIVGGLFSFLLGTLVDLPYILFSGKATYIYLIMGFQVGVVQGFATVVVLTLVFESLNNKFKLIMKGN